MADSVGQIGLDLVVNQGQFNKQMKGIQGIAKKAGAALAGAFAVKKIVDFAAQCIELGSDLQEVQNVVDVTFPKMSKQVDEFAKNAAASFGLSETMAKRFTGTFGAMAKAFGFSEQAAYEMSTTLTGLAGDVASFYNISQDEAYTKLKSVFTGETESLKDLGVVMTQSALDAYALANGYDKTTKSMSEMEKVALRYQFVQDQLSASSGDFIRTSDSWANQVRILKLQLDSLKATIGQGLINVLTPVIKVINSIIGKLLSLANAFKAFTEMITGKKGSGGVSSAAGDMSSVADSADKVGAAMGGAGSAAKKAAKDIKTATTGIDELNILNPDTGNSSGSGGAGGYDVDDFDMGSMDTSAMDEMDSKYQKLIDKAKELKDLFVKGFWDGFGDTSVFDSIAKSIDSIKNSLKEIFLDPEVIAAAEGFADAVAYNLGRVVGSVASIGATIADNLLGGIAIFLEQNTDRIKDYLISMFNIGAEIATIAGDYSSAIAEIFTAFRSDSAKQLTANLIGIFYDTFMGITEIGAKFSRDILDVLTRPFIDNQGQFKSAIEGFLGPLAEITGVIKDVIDNTMDKLNETYDANIRPVFDAIAAGLSSIAGVFLDAFQNYILPVFNNLAERLGPFAEQYLQPMINKAIELLGKAGNAVSALWTNIIQPFVEWFISTTAPLFAGALQSVIDTFFIWGEMVAGVCEGIMTILGGIIDFLTGIFTGNWSLAWEGIKEILSGVWDGISSIIRGALEFIGVDIGAVWNQISTTTSAVWNKIKTTVTTLWNNLKTQASTIFNTIKNSVSTVWNNLKVTTSAIWDGIKNTLSGLWNTVKTTAETTFNEIKDAITGVWDNLKEKTGEIWDGIWSTIKGVINSIIGGVESMVNRVVDGINTIINGVNSVGSMIPGDFIPSIPNLGQVSLPRLAQGGFVRANTPQLAMIGDNRHYGEIVAPEDKMQEMVDRAVAMASRDSTGMSDYYLEMMVDLLQRIIEIIEQMDLTVTIDIRDIKKKLADLDKRSGYTLRTT